MSGLDFTRLLETLEPTPDGEKPMRHRSGVVDAVNSDGTVDVIMSGLVIPGLSVLAGASVSVGDTVQIAVWPGDMLVLGAVRDSEASSDFDLIAESIAGGASATLSVTLPQTHHDIKVEIFGNHDGGAAFASGSVRFNGISGTGYSSAWHRTANDGSTATGGGGATSQIDTFVGSTVTSWIFEVPQYTVVQNWHSLTGAGSARIGAGGTSAARLYSVAGNWLNNSAVTSFSMTITALNWAAGSVMRAYGLGRL